jgi:predicted nucleic acid-binding Zn ribbon protein
MISVCWNVAKEPTIRYNDPKKKDASAVNVRIRTPRVGFQVKRARKVKPLETETSAFMLLKGAFDKSTWQQIQDVRVLDIWEETVGEEIFRVAKAESFQAGILTVKVDHPVWRSELALMSKDIIRKLNQALGKVQVRRLRFV